MKKILHHDKAITTIIKLLLPRQKIIASWQSYFYYDIGSYSFHDKATLMKYYYHTKLQKATYFYHYKVSATMTK
jgi:hypothetical protein